MILTDGEQMGKTVTALACFTLAKVKKILIVCPNALIKFWWEHIRAIMAKANKCSNVYSYTLRVLDWIEE